MPDARKLPRVSHEEMLEMAAMGSKVLALRSVEFARNHDVPLHVRSSFHPEEGTWITKETPGMEQAIVSGIAHDSDEAKITISRRAGPAGRRGPIFTALADAQRQRRHDHPERRATTARPTCRSPCRWTSCAGRSSDLEGVRDELGYRELIRATTRSARSRWSARA